MRNVSSVLLLVITSAPFGCSGVPHAVPIGAHRCDSTALAIHDVQGLGEESPFAGQAVTIEGVVVGDFQAEGSLGGFFLQEPSSRIDDDTGTSEGIFVYQEAGEVALALGDIASVTGMVKEYRGLTEISDVTQVRVCGRSELPTPVTATLPMGSDVDWEAYEGMLIEFPQPLYVADTSNLGHYGEMTLSSSPRLHQPTDTVAPGAEAQSLQLANERSKLVLDDGRIAAYPPSLRFLGTENTVRIGDSVQGLTGVLGYSFGKYVLYPTSDTGPQFARDNPRPDPPKRYAQALRLVSFNLDNYFVTPDTGSPVCGPQGGLDCRGANSRNEFERQRYKVLSTLRLLDPDIAALIELENTRRGSIEDLVNGLNSVSGEGMYSFIDTGTIGTDAIRVALIYKPAVVNPLGRFAILDSSADPRFNDSLNRPALAQSFAQRSDDEVLTVVVNHLKSKSSSCAADPDMSDGQGPCNGTRSLALRAELSWLATDPTQSGDPDFLIVGDFNAYSQEEPVASVVAGGYANLVAKFGEPAAYSYVFNGQAGALDYAFASYSLLPQAVAATEWHINSDEPSALDYNEEHNLGALYEPNPYRSSDHDPLVVELRLVHGAGLEPSSVPVTDDDGK